MGQQASQTRSPDFAGRPVHQAVTAYLSAWQGKRYGPMVSAIPLEMHQSHGGRLPGEVRLPDSGQSALVNTYRLTSANTSIDPLGWSSNPHGGLSGWAQRRRARARVRHASG
jgi:hypothetical protein